MLCDHPDYLSLVKSIFVSPSDDVPRLVAADWLEEHDERERAEFIRVQCELARLESLPENQSGEYVIWRQEYEPYRKRERELWVCQQLNDWTCDSESVGDVTGWWVDGRDLHTRGTVRRGFVESISLPLAVLLPACGHTSGMYLPDHECPDCEGTGYNTTLARDLFGRHPITTVRLTDREPVVWLDGGWCWISDTSGWQENAVNRRAYLPRHIRSLMEHDYPSRQLADAALSAATVTFCRGLVGLSPLAPPT